MPELLGYGSFVGNGRAPQCCPELLLTPNQAGSLAPSRANNEMADPGGNAPPPLPGQGHVLLLHQGPKMGGCGRSCTSGVQRSGTCFTDEPNTSDSWLTPVGGDRKNGMAEAWRNGSRTPEPVGLE